MLSRRSLLKSLFAIGISAPLGVAALSSDAEAQSRPTSRPPRNLHETRPPRPSRSYTWVHGHWAWDRRRGWVWHGGFWDRTRHGMRLVGPRWVFRRGQWVYEPHRWVRTW